MRFLLIPVLFVLALVTGIALLITLGRGDEAPIDPASIYIYNLDLQPSALTIDDVRRGAREAVRDTGDDILYVREERTEGESDPVTYELWIDWAARASRLDIAGFPSEVVVNGTRSTHLADRMIGSGGSSPATDEDLIARLFDSPLDYVLDLERDDVIVEGIHRAKSNSHPVIVVDFTVPGAALVDYEFPPSSYRIVFDEQFRALGAVEDPSLSLIGRTPVRSSFYFDRIKRSALGEAFFDPRSVFGRDDTPIERLQFAVSTGFQAAWLGEEFETLYLAQVYNERNPSELDDWHRFVHMDYALMRPDDDAFPCSVTVSHPPDFETWRTTRGLLVPDAPRERVLRDVDTALGTAHVVRAYDYKPVATPLRPNPPPFPANEGVVDSVDDLEITPYEPVPEVRGRAEVNDQPVEVSFRCDVEEGQAVELMERLLHGLRRFPD